ncbi:DUF397 domain-containing protein [Streptomyces sp. NPDC006602]|uniref:DUF397 domain-containing protein n=1 Tax=Streptomyces sp. NPDC006602 TaxID=3364751 RepID=UPI0036B1C35A
MSTTPDLTGARWVASSYSGNGGGNCLEVAPNVAATSGLVPVRDSKSPEQGTLTFPLSQWDHFVDFARQQTV